MNNNEQNDNNQGDTQGPQIKLDSGSILKLIIVGAALIVGAFAFIIGVALMGQLTGNNSGAQTTTVASSALCGKIPSEYEVIFQKAGDKWKVQPSFIAAVFYAGEHANSWPSIKGPWASSPVGAQGPFQFMPGTWDSNKQDGDGDGKMDVQNIWDSAFGAAHLLANIGAGGNTTELDSLKDAASRYNSGQPWSKGQNYKKTRPYVNRVIEAFQSFQCSPTNIANIPGLPGFGQYYLSQRDYTKEIENNGCKATTLAMMVNYVLSKPNLVTVPQAWSLGSNFENAAKYGPVAGRISLINLGAHPQTSKIQCYLSNKIPIGIGVRSGAVDNSLDRNKNFTSRTHWAVITGVEGDKFLLADPYFKERTRFSLNAILSNSFSSYVFVPKGKEGMCR